MKVPSKIRNKMVSALKHFQSASQLMSEIDEFFESKGISPESLRCGDGRSLEEIEYGNDVIDAFIERFENGEFEEEQP